MHIASSLDEIKFTHAVDRIQKLYPQKLTEEISKYIRDRITSIGKPEKAKWLENYVKHGIKSKGVGIPEIRQIIKDANKEYKISEEPIGQQVEILNELMIQKFTEDKLAAILYLQLFWKKKYERVSLDLISYWFDGVFIEDWNVCDWLCVRILSPLVDHYPNQTILELKKWNKDKNQWKARASLVPFAQCKTIREHQEIIYDFASELIKREERFCKTVVGWVLREYSKIDRDYVERFLSEFKNWTTREVVQNASKYLSKK